nr:retrovirus-related Pol polyprotein from transposon TNT 1-94 [Tanacetum cinerariifolium]
MRATSSNHAKILAIHEASRESIWLRSVTQHVRESCRISSGQESPTVVHEDNAACIAQLKDEYVKGDKTKHILLKFFFIHDLQKSGDIIVQKALLIRHNTSDSGLGISFDILSFSRYASGLGRASPTKAPASLGAGEKKNVKKPSQTSRGVLIGSKMGFNLKKNIELNPNPFDVLNLVNNDVEFDTNGRLLICEGKPRLLDNDGNMLVSMGIVESDSEVEVVFDDTANLRISTSDWIRGLERSSSRRDIHSSEASFLLYSFGYSNAAILAPTLKDLAAATLNSKVLSKAEYSKKRRPLLLEERGGFTASIAEVPRNRGSRGKAIMDNVVDIPNRSVDHSQAFTGPAPVSRDPIGDVIDKDFFLFAPDPYYATYLEVGVVIGSYKLIREKWDGLHHPILNILTKEVFKDPNVCKTMVDQFPTPREMVRIKALTDDHLAEKMSVLHCFLMSHRGKLLAWPKGRNEKIRLSLFPKAWINLLPKLPVLPRTLTRPRVYKHSLAEKDAKIVWLKASPLSLCLSSKVVFKAWFGSSFLVMNLVGFKSGIAEATLLVATTDYLFLNKVAAYSTQPLSVIVDLEPDRLAHPAVVLAPRADGVSPPLTKELTVTPAPSSAEMFSKDVPPSSVADSGQNKEWLNVMVDTAS